MNLKLKNKRALVTGSTLGIGRAIANSLLAEGADVIINSRSQSKVKKTIDEMKITNKTDSPKITGIGADLSNHTGVNDLISFAQSEGQIDVLINNVGRFTVKDFFDIEDSDWCHIFELNVMSAVRLSRAFLPSMLKQGWGRIIFIGSDQSSKPNPSMAHYAMTKTALVSIARSLSELTRGTEITINSVQVAPTWTEGVSEFIEDLARIEGKTPEAMSRSYFEEGEGNTSLIQRWAEPEEIAKVVTFLSSPISSAINGSSLRADGGMIRSLF